MTWVCLSPPSCQALLGSMVDAAESLCPHVMKRSSLRQDLLKACTSKMVVPTSFVTKTLLEQSGVDIINKIRCVCVCVCVCPILHLGPTLGSSRHGTEGMGFAK